MQPAAARRSQISTRPSLRHQPPLSAPRQNCRREDRYVRVSSADHIYGHRPIPGLACCQRASPSALFSRRRTAGWRKSQSAAPPRACSELRCRTAIPRPARERRSSPYSASQAFQFFEHTLTLDDILVVPLNVSGLFEPTQEENGINLILCGEIDLGCLELAFGR